MVEQGRPLGSMIVSLGMDGTKFENGLKSIQNQFRLAKSEMQANLASLDSTSSAYDKAATKVDGLTRVIEVNDRQLKSLNDTYDRQVKLNGEYSNAAMKTATKIDNLERQQSNYKKQLEQSQQAMRDAERGTSSYQRELDNVKRQLDASVSAFRAQGNEVQANRAEYQKLGQEIKTYDNLIAAEKGKLSDLTRTRGADSSAVQEQSTRIQELQSKQTIAQSQYDKLGKSVAGVSAAHAIASDRISKFSGATQKAGAKITSAGQSMTGFSLAAGGAFIYGAKQATEFQNRMNVIKNLIVTGGESTQDAVKGVTTMTKDARKYSEQYGVSVQKISNGYEDLVKRGYTSKQAIGAMKTEIQGSVASGDDFNDVVKVASTTLESFGMKANSTTQMTKNTNKVVNDLAYAADKTSTGFQDLGIGMSYVGSSAHQAGLTLSETSSAMGILSNNGLEADKAGTGLRKVLNSLTSSLSDGASGADKNSAAQKKLTTQITEHETKLKRYQNILDTTNATNDMSASKLATVNKQRANAANSIEQEKLKIQELQDKINSGGESKNALVQLGIDPKSLLDSHGKLKDLSSVMDIINQHTQGMAQGEKAALFTKIFGTTGQQAGLILSNNTKELKELNEEVSKSSKNDYVGGLSAKNMQSAQNNLKVFKEVVSNLSMTFAETLLPTITKVAKSLTNMLKKLDDMSPGMKKFTSYGILIGAALAPVLIIIGKVVLAIGAIGKAIEFMMNLNLGPVIAVMTGPIGIAVGVVAALAGAFFLAYKHIKPFRDAVNQLVISIKKAFSQIPNIFNSVVNSVKKFFNATSSDKFNMVRSALQNIFPKPLADFIAGNFKQIGSVFVSVKDSMIDTGHAIGDALSPIFNGVGDLFKNVVKSMKSFWDNDGNSILQAFKNIFGGIFTVVSTQLNLVLSVAGFVLNAVLVVIRGALDLIKNVFSSIWGNIEEIVRGALDIIKGIFEIFAGIFTGNWSEVWNGVKNIFRGIWDAMQGLAKGALNAIIGFINTGIDGIDEVSKFFSGHETSIHHLKHLEKGTDSHEGGPALINDAKGSHYQEMVVTPDQQAFILPQRNVLLDLPRGSQVINGERTHDLLNGRIPHYAEGKGILNSVVDWTKGKMDDVGSWIGDKTKAVTEFLKDPLKSLTNIWNKATGSIKLKAGFEDEMGHGAGTFIIKNAVDWFKNMLQSAKKEFDAAGSADSANGAISKGDFAKLANQAAELMHTSLSGSDIDRLYWQAFVESNVNPATGGGYDDHDGTGLPVGLFQYKLGTWQSYAVHGHGNIHSALDQIMAVLNDPNWRSDLAPLGSRRGWGPSGAPRYENGGIVTREQLAWVGENNRPEAIIPLTNKTRAMQVLAQAKAYLGEDDESRTSIGTDNGGQGSDRDMIKLLQIQNGLLGKILNAILGQNTDGLSLNDLAQMLDNKSLNDRHLRGMTTI